MLLKLIKIIKMLVKRYFNHGVGRAAAEFAYYFFFSFFPLLIFLNSIIGALKFDIKNAVFSSTFIPDEAKSIILGYIDYVSANGNSFIMFIGIFLALYSASLAVNSIMRSINISLDGNGNRGFKNIAASITFTLLIAVQIFLTLVILVAGNSIMSVVYRLYPALANYHAVFSAARYLIVALFGILSLTLLYTMAPSVHTGMRSSLPGAFLAGIFWLLASLILSFYAANFGNYSLVYGSLGAVIILMLWFFISGAVIIMGGEFNAVLLELNDRKNPHLGQKSM